MLHACAKKFDGTRNLLNFFKLNRAIDSRTVLVGSGYRASSGCASSRGSAATSGHGIGRYVVV